MGGGGVIPGQVTTPEDRDILRFSYAEIPLATYVSEEENAAQKCNDVLEVSSIITLTFFAVFLVDVQT
jgi:hypothetical protein